MIPRLVFLPLSLLTIVFASFSSSSTLVLKSYSVGPGATNTSTSTTYKAQASVGEQANGKTNSTTYTANNGSIQTEQLNIPPAPTLSNGSNTYYNMLTFLVSTGGNPSDTTYAVAVSTNNFITTNYVQGSGQLGASAVYQSDTTWNGVGGTTPFSIIDLSPSTNYEVKVAAKEGLFTNTEYGAYASASTVSPSITFSVSPTSVSIGTLLPGTVYTSSNLTVDLTTNGVSGGNVYVSGLKGGLYSSPQNYTIGATTGNLSSLSSGFGVQATSATETSGGPFATVSPYNGTSNVVGTESTAPAVILSSINPLVGGTAYVNLQAKAASTTPASAAYQETLTFTASGSF